MESKAIAEAAAAAVPYKFAEAFARRDIAGLMALFSPSPEVIYIGTGADERRVGIQQVRNQLQRDLDQADEILFRFDWVRAASAGPVAWTAAEGALIADLRQQRVELPLRFSAVLEVLGGEWLMVQAHLSVPAAGQELGASFPSSALAVAAAVQEERPDLLAQPAPDGTVTILFTDLEDSTLMTERLGDQGWMRLLRTHNAILRRQVQAHGGFEVKSQGDGFMFAFSGGREAILCAIDIQREFAAHNASNPNLPLIVRIGMHAGEVVRERGDFFGRNVVLAARIAAQAPAGSIWVSGLLKDLVEAAGDIRFGPEQLIDLKGLTGLQRVAEVLWQETNEERRRSEE